MEFAVVALLIFYLVPWMFAVARDHERQNVILAANLLLGWTGIGWLAVCAWAIRSDPHASAHRARPALELVEGSATLRGPRDRSRARMDIVRNDA